MKLVALFVILLSLSFPSYGNEVTLPCGLIPSTDVTNAVVRIKSEKTEPKNEAAISFFSGVVIHQYLILTVAHGVITNDDVDITYTKNVTDKATIVKTIKGHVSNVDRNTDLALINTDEKIEVAPIPLALYSPNNVNELVWTIGYPLSSFQQRISLGLVLGINLNTKRMLSTSFVTNGMSGGPVLYCQDKQYKLTGIIHGYIVTQVPSLIPNEHSPVINIGHSVSSSIETIIEFLKKNRQ